MIPLYKDERFDEVWPLIEKVVDKHGGYNKQDIKDSLETGDMQAHAYEQDDSIKMAAITEIRQYPRSRVLLILFAGGANLSGWKDTIKQYFEGFAAWNKCNEMQVIGRLGWGRIYPETKTAWAIYRHRIST